MDSVGRLAYHLTALSGLQRRISASDAYDCFSRVCPRIVPRVLPLSHLRTAIETTTRLNLARSRRPIGFPPTALSVEQSDRIISRRRSSLHHHLRGRQPTVRNFCGADLIYAFACVR